MYIKLSKYAFAVVLLVSTCCAQITDAQISTWTGGAGADTDYFNGANWSNGVPSPISGDAWFNLIGNYNVTISGNAIVDGVSIFNGNPKFGGGNTLQANGAISGIDGSEVVLADIGTTLALGDLFQIGPTTTGHLTLDNGTEVRGTRELNIQQNSTVEVFGGSLDFLEIYVGQGVTGSAELDIRNDGQVDSLIGIIGRTADATVMVSGSSSNWNNIGPLTIASQADGQLMITNGGNVLSFDTIIGQHVQTLGEVTVQDNGSTFNTIGAVTIGSSGEGLLDLRDNGFGSAFDCVMGLNIGMCGTLNVDASSEFQIDSDLFSGAAGIGKVNISGMVTTNGSELGQTQTAQGTINVFSTGDLLVNQDMGVGIEGNGFLNVDGQATMANCRLGDDPLGTGTVSIGPTGILDVSNNIVVGSSGQGIFNVDGDVLASRCIISDTAGSDGDAFVGETGSLQITNDLSVGENDFGTISIEGVTTAFDLVLGDDAGGDGVVVVQETGDLDVVRLAIGSNGVGRMDVFGGDVNVTSQASIASGSQLRLRSTTFVTPLLNNAGSIIFLSGGASSIDADVNNTADGTVLVFQGTFLDPLVNDGEIDVSLIGDVNINDRYSGNGNFSGGGEVYFHDLFQPSNGATVINMDNDVFFTGSSTADFQIGGTSFSQYDTVSVGGDLNLQGGQLNVSLIGGFEPQDGDAFLLYEITGNRMGTFANFAEGDVVLTSGDVEVTITYTGGDGNDIILRAAEIVNVLLGDVNLDGIVSLLDVAPFVDLISSGMFQAEADVNEDGVVDLLDVAPFVAILAGG